MMNKLTFHVPCYTYIDNVLVENCWRQVLEEFSKIADSFYVLDAKGCYKGRCYDEKLIVVYGEMELVEKYLTIVRILEQECYAYEIDNELFIVE